MRGVEPESIAGKAIAESLKGMKSGQTVTLDSEKVFVFYLASGDRS